MQSGELEVAKVLVPYNSAEAMTVGEAAALAHVTTVTMREWAARFDLGRRIGGRWFISRVALAMYLDGDRIALDAYLGGHRAGEIVEPYFRRCGIVTKKI